MSLGLITPDRLAIIDTRNGLDVTAVPSDKALLDLAMHRYLRHAGKGADDLETFEAWVADIRRIIQEERARTAVA